MPKKELDPATVVIDPLAPPLSEPDDIPDPLVPEGVLATLQAEGPAGAPAQTAQALSLSMQADIDQAVHGSIQAALADPAQFNAHEALLHGFCQALLPVLRDSLINEHDRVTLGLSSTLTHVKEWIKAAHDLNEHASYSMADAVTKLQEHGLQITGSPYTATVAAMSPEGFQVMLSLQKPTAGDLVEELGRLVPWLASHQYIGITSTVAL